MDAIENIYKRRSIRKYTDKPVEQDKIITILKAAMAAPTAVNCQPWEFVVVDDKEKISKMKEQLLCARYNAPVAIIVCGNMKLALKGQDHDLWVQDCSAAMQNILLAATSLDLGSVWIGIYPVQNRVKLLKDVFNMPEHIIPLGIAYIGYPDEEKPARTRYDDKKIFWQEYEPTRKLRTKDKPQIGHY